MPTPQTNRTTQLNCIPTLSQTAATRVFKGLQGASRALGVRMSNDIKSHFNLKPMTGSELQGAAAAALQRTLQVQSALWWW